MKSSDRPIPKNPDTDPYLSAENIESMAETLMLVTRLEDRESLKALKDLRDIWRKDAMGKASLLIKTKDKTAYDRLFKLVLEANKSTEDKTEVDK